MNPEKFRILAQVVAAHPGSQVVGRTRLQKTIKLLQRLGLPTDYDYTNYFYGPYSEAVQSDIRLLEQIHLTEETSRINQDGSVYYIIKAKEAAVLPEPFQRYVNQMARTDPVVLELAATYDAFRELGADHKKALEQLRQKKGTKCENGNEEKAVELLRNLNLDAD